MVALVLRRVLTAVPTLFGITLFVFLLLRAVPGDPVAYYIGQLGPVSLGPDAIERLRHEYGLDQSPVSHYFAWVGDALRLDLGVSFVDRRPVTERIAEKLPATLLLNSVALFVALLFALPLGVRLARSPGAEERVSLALLALMSIPAFWAGLILAEVLAVQWQILPLYGMGETGIDRLRHMVLPALCLTYGQLAFFTRMTASTVREQISLPHAVAARARGAAESRIAWRYGMRPSAVTLASLGGIILPSVISGSVIIERLFAWDGVGRLYVDAVTARDYPLVMGLTLLTAIAVLATNLVIDVVYLIVDPRTRSRSLQ